MVFIAQDYKRKQPSHGTKVYSMVITDKEKN